MAGHRKNKRKTVEYGRYGYMFIAPFFIVYLLFSLWPLIYTFWLSTQEYYFRGMKEVGPTFAGIKNFIKVFIESDANGTPLEGAKLFDTMTFRTLGNTVILWMLNFIPQIALSLLLAAWFTDTRVKLKAQGAYKVMVYMPNIITAASIAVLFYSLFGIQGPITTFLRDMGIIDRSGIATDVFMQSKLATRLIIGFIQFWMWYGNTMILLIAGILGISPSLFEAARVDGASSWQIFKNITLPLLRPILLFVLVTSAVGGLQMYDIPAVFNVDNSGDGLPDYASQTITMYIRKLAMMSRDIGKAATISVVLFVFTLIISLFFFFFLGDREKKQKKVKHAE
ncbi:MAG: sugar ABC transporter permease [Lachnospiraceae bacterium]|nr:sugar ABC transporter permease [Lachnospiraceae bacterium]